MPGPLAKRRSTKHSILFGNRSSAVGGVQLHVVASEKRISKSVRRMHRRDAAMGTMDLHYMSEDEVTGDVLTEPGGAATTGQPHGSVIAVSATDVAALASFSEGGLMCAIAHRLRLKVPLT